MLVRNPDCFQDSIRDPKHSSGVPQAILETHPTISNQRALMTTLVPKFALKSQKPEIIFIADRSGSMGGQIPTLVAALKVFLKSIPVGCMFNICSFGSKHSFLWSESKIYDEETLAEAIASVEPHYFHIRVLNLVIGMSTRSDRILVEPKHLKLLKAALRSAVRG